MTPIEVLDADITRLAVWSLALVAFGTAASAFPLEHAAAIEDAPAAEGPA